MTTATKDLLLAASDVEIQASGKTPTVSIVAYSGGLMTVPGWGPVVLDLSGVDVSARQISILADHDSTLRGVVGFGQATVTGNKLIVAGTIAQATDAARQIVVLAKSGFQFQASVGVAPSKWDRVRAGELVEVNGRAIRATGQGFTLVRASALKEVSIVAIGADAGTSVSITASKEGEEALMTKTTEKTADDIRAEAAAETERITAIRRVCDGKHGDIEAQAIREGWDAQKTELEVLRASRPSAPFIHTAAVSPTRDVIEAAILAHMGHEHLAEKHLGPQAAQQARDLRATSLVDLCRAALLVDQRDVPSGREAMIRAALSTYSLPTALGSAANKLLLDAYTESPATSVFVDRCDRLLDLSQSFVSPQLRAYEFAPFSAGYLRVDATVPFGLPAGGQPGDRKSAVVSADRRAVRIRQGRLKLDPPGDLVGVHRVVLSLARFVVPGEASFASRVTHEPWISQELKPGKAAFCRDFACFSGTPQVAQSRPVSRCWNAPIRRRKLLNIATRRAVWRQSRKPGRRRLR